MPTVKLGIDWTFNFQTLDPVILRKSFCSGVKENPQALLQVELRGVGELPSQGSLPGSS